MFTLFALLCSARRWVSVRERNLLTQGLWRYSRSNSAMTELRRANLNGVYDTHTNMMFYPKIMQPTQARWEEVLPSSAAQADQNQQLTNGVDHPLTNGTGTDPDAMDISSTFSDRPTIFHPVPHSVSRTFTVIDTVFSSPPLSGTGYPGPDGSIMDATSGSNGLSSIANEVVEELPPECREAFERERAKERGWKGSWGCERVSGSRRVGGLRIGLGGWPV